VSAGSTPAGQQPIDSAVERFDVVVVGGGQAGLATGYHLARRGLHLVILEANQRIGDNWRSRWDSLRLFTPARYDGLPGMRFPGIAGSAFPTRTQMADYLEAYAARMKLPVRTGVRVERLSAAGAKGGYVIRAGGTSYEADQVVIATGAFGIPLLPDFAAELDPTIRQLHSSEYLNPAQLRDGPVLVVGAGNSGAEIALDIAPDHETWLSGRDPGHIPFRIDSRRARVLFPMFWFMANHVITVNSPIGRRMAGQFRSHGMPVVRVKPDDVLAAGVERVGRTVGVRGGQPLLEDGRVLQVTNVIWCTGLGQDYRWIELPILGDHGRPAHARGVVPAAPGIYFMGLVLQRAVASVLVGGVGRDAAYIADKVATRAASL
jgi:putative flavoprotein involved in K+ transport